MDKRGMWAAGLIGAVIVEASAIRTATGPEAPLLVLVHSHASRAPRATTGRPPAVEPPPARCNPGAPPDATVSAQAAPNKLDAPARWWITASGGATVSDGCFQLDQWPFVTCGSTGGGGSSIYHG